MGWRPSLSHVQWTLLENCIRLEAIAIGLEANASRLEAIAVVGGHR